MSNEVVLWARNHALGIGAGASRATVSLISMIALCRASRSQDADWLGSLGQVVET